MQMQISTLKHKKFLIIQQKTRSDSGLFVFNTLATGLDFKLVKRRVITQKL